MTIIRLFGLGWNKKLVMAKSLGKINIYNQYYTPQTNIKIV